MFKWLSHINRGIKRGLRFCFKDRWFRYLLIITVAFALLGGVLFNCARRQMDEALIEQRLYRQQVIARAGAITVDHFLNDSGKALAVLATRGEMESYDAQMVEGMRSFIDRWEGQALVEVVVLDSQGMVKYAVDRISKEPISAETDSSDRRYFLEAKNLAAGRYFIGDPINARGGSFQDSYVIPISTPIVRQNRLLGVLVSSVLVKDLINDYLEPLRIAEETRVYILNDEGLILSSTPIDILTGVNYFELIKQKPYPGSDKAEMRMRQIVEGSDADGRLVLDLRNEETGKMDRFLVNYSRVIIDQTNGSSLVLAILSPLKKVLRHWAQFQTQLRLIVLFWLSMVVVFCCLLIAALRYVQRDAFEDGWKEAREYWQRKLKRK